MRSAILLGLPLAALAIPPPATSIEDPLEKRAEDFIPYLIEDSCRNTYDKHPDIKRYDKMLAAVKSARELAKTAVKEWWDEGKHGDVAAQYLAIPDDGGYKDSGYAQTVHANLQNVATLDERIPFLSKKVTVHCTDISNKCSLNVEGTNKLIAGYAENGGNVITGYTYDVALCETWYLTQTLDDAWNAWKNDPKENIAMEWLENDAGKMLHEMMHINMMTQDRPHIEDMRYNGARAYTAPKVAEWVANGASTGDVIKNADSYTQFVNAIYFKNKFGYLPPPVREVPVTERQDCVGEENQYVDSVQDKHIADFCDQIAAEYTPGSIGEIVRQYDEGKPDHVQLRFYRRPGGKLGPNAVKEVCLDTMPKLFHNCDTTSKWKHGGVYTFTQGDDDLYTYYVEPRHVRPDPIPEKTIGKCDVWYKFAYDEFYISGGLFAGNDHGQEKLLPNLRSCGVVSEWRFDYKDEPDSNNVEWDAYGRLPIGSQMWGCVRQAMIDAGGPSDMGCGGK